MNTVRVATLNNFNCTPAEWAQLDTIASQNPDSRFFINCNARTPLLNTINDHPYPAVITLNPDLVVDPGLVSRVLSLDRSKLAFVRVKWLPAPGPSRWSARSHRSSWPGRDDITNLIRTLRNAGIEVVITAQRFNSHASMAKALVSPGAYALDCARFRLSKEAWRGLTQFARVTGARICDRRGLGCQSCRLCSSLTGGSGKILSLNLSCSGLCPYNCPDCYAKTMINFRIKIGQKPLAFDVIQANRKQSGQTKHIKNHKKAA